MTITRTKDGVPGWNGDPASWLEFRQFVASTKFEARYTCGPKIAAELTGAARTAIMGKKSSWLSEEQGTETLLQHLQKTIGEPALPEVGNFLRQYFKVLKRQKGESMTAFCVRHRDEYERMCRALARMLKEQKQEVKSTMPSSSQSAAAENVGEMGDGHGKILGGRTIGGAMETTGTTGIGSLIRQAGHGHNRNGLVDLRPKKQKRTNRSASYQTQSWDGCCWKSPASTPWRRASSRER